MASSNGVGRLPLGVAILAILIGIFGFFVFLGGLLAVLLGVSIAGYSTVFGLSGILAGVVILILGLVILAVAVGLWNQELWALALAVLVLLVYGVVEYVSGEWLGLIIVALLVVYLVAVRSHFD